MSDEMQRNGEPSARPPEAAAGFSQENAVDAPRVTVNPQGSTTGPIFDAVIEESNAPAAPGWLSPGMLNAGSSSALGTGPGVQGSGSHPTGGSTGVPAYAGGYPLAQTGPYGQVAPSGAGGGGMQGELMPANPMNGNPMHGNPMHGSPMNGNALTGNGLSGNPLHAQALAHPGMQAYGQQPYYPTQAGQPGMMPPNGAVSPYPPYPGMAQNPQGQGWQGLPNPYQSWNGQPGQQWQPGMQQAMPQGMQQAMPQGMQQAMPQGMQQAMPQGMQQAMPQGMQPGMQQTMPQGMTQPGPQNMPWPYHQAGGAYPAQMPQGQYPQGMTGAPAQGTNAPQGYGGWQGGHVSQGQVGAGGAVTGQPPQYGYGMPPINVVVQNTHTSNQVVQNPVNQNHVQQHSAPETSVQPVRSITYVVEKGDVLVKTTERTKAGAVVMSLLMGWVGGQYFYLGKQWRGILSVLFFWTSIPTIIGFYHALKFMMMSRDEFDRLYNYERRTAQELLPPGEGHGR